MAGGRRARRFPGYDVLDQRRHWDGRTRDVVMQRLEIDGEARFFSRDEEPACRALLTALLALAEEEVAVFEMIDARLAAGIVEGWHYDDMPPDAEAWRRSIAELNKHSFATMDREHQSSFLDHVQAKSDFAGMPGARLWALWMRYACTAFYSHPFAWNEIGFGGPAYPRGYKNLGVGRREPWEVAEVGASDPVRTARRMAEMRSAAPAERRAG